MLQSITSTKNKSLLKDFIRNQYLHVKTKDISEACDLILDDVMTHVAEKIQWNPTPENIAEVNIMVWKRAKKEIDKIFDNKVKHTDIVIEPRNYSKEDPSEVSTERIDMRQFRKTDITDN